MPEPLPPTNASGATQEEIAFFDRVKKFISNKSTMNEFLKLCNLFSQDLINKNVLVHKVSNFIGGNPDLMNWFRQFVAYDGEEEVIDNVPKAPTGRVALSNCRGLGPSYRLLPKRVRATISLSIMFSYCYCGWGKSELRKILLPIVAATMMFNLKSSFWSLLLSWQAKFFPTR